MAFERVCSLDEIAVDEAKAVDCGPLQVALVRDGDEVFAIQDLCSHASVALSEGEVTVDASGCFMECWLHGSTFDLRTGKPTILPATEPVATFAVEVRGADVYVDVDAVLNGVTPA
ncbi:MAG: non-heme iron oxygenase ferredoxin subunit [Nocardioides sp.]